jgi:hypothetical protein
LYIFNIFGCEKLGLDPQSGMTVAASLSAAYKIQVFFPVSLSAPKKAYYIYLSTITGFIAQEVTINIL